jgi:two-component system chemotaxis response regulator CheB
MANGSGDAAGRPDRVPFDVVALVASAGGLSAVDRVLSQLPENLPAAVVVVQHLGGAASRLVDILGRHSPLPAEWIADHVKLEPGRVYVCPPRQLLAVLPDAECSLRPMEYDDRLRPIDFFLTSLAGSYGPRVMAVVLTGMGYDSTVGCQRVSQAGGTVLVQSPDSAEHTGMPLAVIDSGAADLVLPLSEIGQMIAQQASASSRRPHERAADRWAPPDV